MKHKILDLSTELIRQIGHHKEIESFQSLYGGQFTLSTQLINQKLQMGLLTTRLDGLVYGVGVLKSPKRNRELPVRIICVYLNWK